jgi:hypothetical protein
LAINEISTIIQSIHNGVELHFENSDGKQNKDLFRKLENFRIEIETTIPESTIFQPEWAVKWSRIYIPKNEVQLIKVLNDWLLTK